MGSNETSKVRGSGTAAKRTTMVPNTYTPTVYALLDADWTPLYVGSSLQLAKRIATHRSKQAWWEEVAYLAWTVVPSGRHGTGRYVDERMVTASLAPKYNVANNHGPGSVATLARLRAAALARSAEFPEVRCLRRPLEVWIESLASGTIRHARRRVVAVAAGPVSGWRLAA